MCCVGLCCVVMGLNVPCCVDCNCAKVFCKLSLKLLCRCVLCCVAL